MLTGEEVMEIRILHRQGRSIRAIARDLKVSRETVRRYLREPDREPGYGSRMPNLRANAVGSRPTTTRQFRPA